MGEGHIHFKCKILKGLICISHFSMDFDCSWVCVSFYHFHLLQYINSFNFTEKKCQKQFPFHDSLRSYTQLDWKCQNTRSPQSMSVIGCCFKQVALSICFGNNKNLVLPMLLLHHKDASWTGTSQLPSFSSIDTKQATSFGYYPSSTYLVD